MIGDRNRRLVPVIGLVLMLSAGVGHPAAGQTGACSLIYVENGPIGRVFPYNPLATSAERRAVDLLFEPLVRKTTGGTKSLLLDLSGARASTDGTEWTFPLKSTTWHSERPVTADQIVKTYQELRRLYDSGYQEWTYELTSFPQIAEMRSSEGSLVVRYTKVTDASMAQESLCNFFVIPWDDIPKLCTAYQCHLNEYVPLGTEPRQGLTGNGRWASARGTKGMIGADGTIALASFDDFPGGVSSIAEIQSRVQPLQNQRANMFRNGLANVVLEMPILLLSQVLSQVPGAQEIVHEMNSFTSIQISTRSPALQDERVREAMVFALNRKAMLDALYDGKGYVLDAPFPPETRCWNRSVTPRDYSPERARKLLTDAGFKGSPEAGWRKGSVTLDDLVFLIERSVQGAEDQAVMKRVIDQLGELGIHVTSDEVIPADLQSRLENGDYDFYLDTRTVGNAWNVEPILSSTFPGRKENAHLFCSPEVKQALDKYQPTIGVDDILQSEVGHTLHEAIATHCDRIYLWALIRKGVFNSSEIEFEKFGTYLFANPGLWKCHE